MKALRNYYNGQQSAYLPGGVFVQIAGNLQCSHCHRVVTPYDFQALDAGAFEIICAGCHSTLISCKPVT